MENLVVLRLMFVAGLVVMAVATSLLALGLERLGSAIRRRVKEEPPLRRASAGQSSLGAAEPRAGASPP